MSFANIVYNPSIPIFTPKLFGYFSMDCFLVWNSSTINSKWEEIFGLITYLPKINKIELSLSLSPSNLSSSSSKAVKKYGTAGLRYHHSILRLIPVYNTCSPIPITHLWCSGIQVKRWPAILRLIRSPASDSSEPVLGPGALGCQPGPEYWDFPVCAQASAESSCWS